MLAFIASIAASAALATATPAEPERSLIDVVTRVEVDATGAIVAIDPPAKTAPEINRAVEAGIRNLHFSPPKLEGKPVGGATWVHMQVCSVQGESDPKLALRYASSGVDWIDPSVPVYPVDSAMSGASASFDVELEVQPDGTAKLIKAKPVEIHGHLRDFLRAVHIWADEQRFHPQEVDGKPVADRVSTNLNWKMGKSVPEMELDAKQRELEANARAIEEKSTNEGCEAILASRPAEVESYPDGHPPENRVVVRP